MKIVKALRQLWKSKFEILEGINNFINRDEYVESIASTRMSICEECPLLDLKGSKCFAPGTEPCCGSCGCSLKLKTRSLESECPEGKW